MAVALASTAMAGAAGMSTAQMVAAGAFSIKLAKDTMDWLFSDPAKPPPVSLTEEARELGALARGRFSEIKMGEDMRSQVLGLFQVLSDTATAATDASVLTQMRAEKVRVRPHRHRHHAPPPPPPPLGAGALTYATPTQATLADKVKGRRLDTIAAALAVDEREVAAQISSAAGAAPGAAPALALPAPAPVEEPKTTTAAPRASTRSAGKVQRKPRVKKTPVDRSRGREIIVDDGVVKQRVYVMTAADVAQRKKWKRNYTRYKDELAKHRASLPFTYKSAEQLAAAPPTPEMLDTQPMFDFEADKKPNGRPPTGLVFCPKYGGFYVPAEAADSEIITVKDLIAAFKE